MIPSRPLLHQNCAVQFVEPTMKPLGVGRTTTPPRKESFSTVKALPRWCRNGYVAGKSSVKAFRIYQRIIGVIRGLRYQSDAGRQRFCMVLWRIIALILSPRFAIQSCELHGRDTRSELPKGGQDLGKVINQKCRWSE